MSLAGTEGGFAIYVHWPFCQSKCPYCDFNSHVREAVDEARWRRALLAELDHYAAETAGRHCGGAVQTAVTRVATKQGDPQCSGSTS